METKEIVQTSPDGWVLIKAELPEGVEYFVFGCWVGGYLDGDRWQRNSGVEKVEEEEDAYVFHGYSGSRYRCRKTAEGRLSGYCTGVVNTMIKRDEVSVVTMEDEYDSLPKDS